MGSQKEENNRSHLLFQMTIGVCVAHATRSLLFSFEIRESTASLCFCSSIFLQYELYIVGV